MEMPNQETQGTIQDTEESTQNAEQITEEEYASTDQEESELKEDKGRKIGLKFGSGERSGFVHGLSVGLGIGCIATFVIMWITVFFTPQLSGNVTYENMLSIFIYPLIYLLAVGLIALTAGIVREYCAIRAGLNSQQNESIH